MATNNNENAFSSPWNNSDVVFVVEKQELHIHKAILILQSPVFKAMLEASEEKIALEGKNLKSMVPFLQMLYPPSMFKKSKAPLNDENRLPVMALAEEYECVNLITQSIDDAAITPENVLKILPYAAKYHQTALPRMYNVINWSAPASELREVLPTLESKETLIKMLLNKCHFQKSSIVEMQDAMFSLMLNCLKEKKKADVAYESLQSIKAQNPDVNFSGSYSGSLAHTVETALQETARDSRCVHVIQIREIDKTKGCPHCKEKYKEKFFAPIPGCEGRTQYYFDMLQKGNDIATAVKEKK